MALFGKKQPETQIPELQEYYATQKQQSPVVAWLLAFTSLLVTIAILVGFFYGGRWLYRKITEKDTPSTTTSQNDTKKTDTNGSTDVDANKDTSTSGTVTTPPTNGGISGSIGGNPSTPAQGVSPNQPSSTNQGAVAATTDIPNTGAGLNALFIVGIVIVGYVVRIRKMAKK